MRVILEVTEGPLEGRRFALPGHDSFLVGRSRRAHLRLPSRDLYVSRIHFLLEISPLQCRLMDLGSRNGTHINGVRVEIAELMDGDVVKAGRTTFRVHLDAHADPAPRVERRSDADEEATLRPTLHDPA
jgi:serine/threonine-protein kinase